MSLRQAVALTASVLILHLGFVAQEARCTQEVPAPSNHHEHSQTPTPKPDLPVCCQALTSCAVSVAVTSPPLTVLGGSIASRLAGAKLTRPHSYSATPEAPPPKA